MADIVVYVRANRAAVRDAIERIPQEALAGGATANAMMVRCGMTALRRIRNAFIIKSLGGTDEAGDSWKPLKPETIAYSRRNVKKFGNPKDSRVFSRSKNLADEPIWIPKQGIRAGYRPSYALTDKQNARWWEVYKRQLMYKRGNKAHAAAVAWTVLKAEGATTLIAQYGNTQVKILTSTGVLLNSLSPGTTDQHQIFRIGPGEVIVGTNRPHCSAHHEGKGHNPQRRLWPEPIKWPSTWWLDIAEQGRGGLIDIAIQLIRSL